MTSRSKSPWPKKLTEEQMLEKTRAWPHPIANPRRAAKVTFFVPVPCQINDSWQRYHNSVRGWAPATKRKPVAIYTRRRGVWRLVYDAARTSPQEEAW